MGAEAEQTALNVTVCPAEVRWRGLIVVSLLGELGVCVDRACIRWLRRCQMRQIVLVGTKRVI